MTGLLGLSGLLGLLELLLGGRTGVYMEDWVYWMN
jgi:hypothetical protein